MIYTSNGIWIISLRGDYKNIYYTYSIEVNGTVNITNDPYNIACGVNGKRSMIIDLNDTNPPNWDKDNHVFYPLDKTFIYEIHIKDFSASEGSGIPKEHRGKYLAFTYPNTCYNNDPSKPTCMNYLKYLGITTVQIITILLLKLPLMYLRQIQIIILQIILALIRILIVVVRIVNHMKNQ